MPIDNESFMDAYHRYHKNVRRLGGKEFFTPIQFLKTGEYKRWQRKKGQKYKSSNVLVRYARRSSLYSK